MFKKSYRPWKWRNGAVSSYLLPGTRVRIVGKRRKNRRWRKKKNGERMGKGPPSFPPPQDTAQLASLTDIFSIWHRFLAFSPNAEPGPRLSYLQIRWPQLYQVFVHGSIRWFQIVATSQLHKCSSSGGRTGLWTATSWRKTDSKWCVRNFLWINLGVWETAHLPLP